jgi:hypothetical protein
LLFSVLTVQCDRSQFSMAQVGTGAKGNSHADRTELTVRDSTAAPTG